MRPMILTLRPRRRLTNGEHAGEPSLVAPNVRVRPQQGIYYNIEEQNVYCGIYVFSLKSPYDIKGLN